MVDFRFDVRGQGSMRSKDVEVIVHEDETRGTHADLKFRNQGYPIDEFALSVEDLDYLIEELRKARAGMSPPKALEPPLCSRAVGLINPKWHLEASSIGSYASFALRDPGAGWILALLDKYQVDCLMKRCSLFLVESPIV